MKIYLDCDKTLFIATASSKTAKQWHNKKVNWSDLVSKCSEAVITRETISEYQSMSRDEQGTIKDVGGFVGGYLISGQRKNGQVKFRSCATLDIDFGTPTSWDDFCEEFSCASMMYSTHSYTLEKPRYRLVILFSREVTIDEYEPICRWISSKVGIESFDATTYQSARLFYWPSSPKDIAPFFKYVDDEPLDVDDILSKYNDWHDVSEWPMSIKEKDIKRTEIKKCGDPTDKKGVMGAFCRTYSIEGAIETFLSDIYEPTHTSDRYTYINGTSHGGLVCYNHLFAYSNHQSDPASGRCCNAFDIVRIHKFGLDDEGYEGKKITELPSYKEMCEFASNDENVKKTFQKERTESINTDFEEIKIEETNKSEKSEKVEKADEWLNKLDFDTRGNAKPTALNAMTILENDPKLKEKIWENEFTGYIMVSGKLPWHHTKTMWTDADDSCLRNYFELKYGMSAPSKIKDALVDVYTRNAKHPVRQYLNGLEWDKTPRLDTLLIDCLGAEDNELTRAMTRKQFAAAVKRVYEPGCKFDYCLVFTGAEGIGKSTMLQIMGGEWFFDNLSTLDGKEAKEEVANAWIIELAELSALKHSEVEQVKNFLSRTSDDYRAAYGHYKIKHQRQCVFFATTNEEYFLKGNTGNRRFWVVTLGMQPSKFKNFKALRQWLTDNRDQLWAEALYRYKEGEELYLDGDDLEQQARERQEEHNDDRDDPMFMELDTYLDILLPEDWDIYSISQRIAYFNSPNDIKYKGKVHREYFCAVEFLYEREKIMKGKDSHYQSRKINAYMRSKKDWETKDYTHHNGNLYGTQRGFHYTGEISTKSENDIDDDDL